MTLFLWILLSIGVPLLGPLAALALTSATHGASTARALMLESIQHGQLYWSCTALSAAAIYEAVDALYAGKESKNLLVFAIVIYMLVAIASSIIVMLATTKAHQERYSRPAKAAGRSLSPLSTPLVKVSLGLTGFVAISFTSFHWWLS